jgi:outer membrane lipoprotein-sorting protein
MSIKIVMRNTFRLLSFVLLTGLLSPLLAQNAAENLLRNVIDQTKSYKAMKVDFDYRMINEDAGIDELKTGEVFIQGDAYKLVMAGQKVISNGETIWTILEDSEEVMVSDALEGEESITPSKLLTSYYEDHKISFVSGGRRTEAEGIRTIELKPEEGRKFSKIQIDIDEQNLQIKQFTIFDNGGNEFVYSILALDSTFQPEADFFRFNSSDYPDYELIDMR